VASPPKADHERPLGAVLTGGRSRRMGTDKALVLIDGRAMVDRVAAALRPACIDVVAVGPARLAGNQRAVADLHPDEGPLGAILTALAVADSAVFVAACDLAHLTTAAVERVVGAARDGVDVVVAGAGDTTQPLCSLWQPSATAAVSAVFAAGERSVRRALAGLRVERVEVDPLALRNVNAPEDLGTL
jgi:molybdopterin-guanine dinucleotide biosynthesis protein A